MKILAMLSVISTTSRRRWSYSRPRPSSPPSSQSYAAGLSSSCRPQRDGRAGFHHGINLGQWQPRSRREGEGPGQADSQGSPSWWVSWKGQWIFPIVWAGIGNGRCEWQESTGRGWVPGNWWCRRGRRWWPSWWSISVSAFFLFLNI